MDREHRRELKHDRFVDEVGNLSVRAQDNQRLLMIIAGAGLALAILIYGIYFYRSGREQRAQAALSAGIETIESPLQPPAGGQPVPNAKFKTNAERLSAAEKQFVDVEGKYKGSDAADIAGLYMARISSSRGDVAGAKGRLQHFIDDHPKHLLVGAARYSLYQIRVENGDAASVVSELQGQIGKADAPLPSDAMLALLAHAYDVQGNSAKSKETFRRIITEFPDSPYAVEAQRRIGPA